MSRPTRPKTLARSVASGTGQPVPRLGRPPGDRDAKKTELLKAAMSVIAQEGYGGASLRKVAERAGCTTGAVTYYFANKEEMLTAVAESLFDEFDGLLEAHRDRIDVKALLEHGMNRTKGKSSNLWLVLFQMLAHARHEAAFATVVQKRYARFRDTLTAILERGQKEGTIRSDIPADLLADQLSAISDGWMMMFPIEPERFRPKRLRELLDGVARLVGPTNTRVK
jgi:AcrR family transcriptional regulator